MVDDKSEYVPETVESQPQAGPDCPTDGSIKAQEKRHDDDCSRYTTCRVGMSEWFDLTKIGHSRSVPVNTRMVCRDGSVAVPDQSLAFIPNKEVKNDKGS